MTFRSVTFRSDRALDALKDQRLVVIPADTPVWRSAAEDDRIRTEREARVDVTRPMPQRGIVTKGSGGGTTEDREGEGGVCA